MESPDSAELIIVGGLHGRHNTVKRYTPEALREILLALRPHRFCVETEPQHIGDDGYARPVADLEAERARMPDGVVLDEVSRQLQIRLIPFEWEGWGKRLRETGHWKRQARANAQLQRLLSQLAAVNPACVECKVAEMLDRAEQCQLLLDQNAGPEIINSEVFDNVVRIKYSFPLTLLPLLAKHEGHEEMLADWRFIFDEWEERNTIMAENLTRICGEHPGKRLVVATGCEHRFALRDRLAGRPGIELREFWEVLGAGWSPSD
jgi:hypothetical protein